MIVAINGRVVGDLCVDTLYLGRSAVVHGNIMCRSLKMDRAAVLVGQLSVSKELDVGIDAYKAAAVNSININDNVEEGDDEMKQSVLKNKTKGRVVLLVLLPQVDFFSDNSDLGESKFCEFLKKNTNSIDSIYITLDMHHVSELPNCSLDRANLSNFCYNRKCILDIECSGPLMMELVQIFMRK